MARPDRTRQGGFSLIEAVVALALLAVTAGTLLQLFSTSLTSSRRAGLIASATLVAQSQLAMAETAEQWRDGVWAGDDPSGLRWTRIVRRVDAQARPGPLGALFEVEVAVGEPGKGEPVVRLQTLRLAAAR